MIGLLFLGTVGLWLTVCIWVARRVGRLASQPLVRAGITLLILIFLCSLPFVDESIGKRQFESLCKRNGIENADLSMARGKKVRVKYGERMPVTGAALPMKESLVLFSDVNSGEPVLRFKNYYASGGWVMRYTWLSMGSDHPMLFAGNGCGFEARDSSFRANQITVVN